jgi:outer membrane protein
MALILDTKHASSDDSSDADPLLGGSLMPCKPGVPPSLGTHVRGRARRWGRRRRSIDALSPWRGHLAVHLVWATVLGWWAAALAAQMPSSPNALWQPPNLQSYTRELKRPERAIIDPGKRYELVELIDLAQRLNPETRVAWERARQAAEAVGLVESAYYPVLALHASAGGQSLPFPIPTNLVSDGFFRADNLLFNPTLALRWLLFDFGQRRASFTAATEQLLAANLGFNSKHQQIVFNVQRSFFTLTSVRGRIAVAQAALQAAQIVQQSAEARLRRGLATLPDVALARQQAAQTAFDLEDVLAKERDAQVALAQNIGIPPTTPIQVADFAALPVPTALEESVEKIIDRTLEQRPDLIAQVAALRAREAEVRRARAEFWPKLSLTADVGGILAHVRIHAAGQPTQSFGETEPTYGLKLTVDWPLFEGGARRRRLGLAEAERRAAEGELEDARDKVIAQVWQAYTDVKLAIRRLDVAAALVDASQKSYEATSESYRRGLGTLIDLLAARRELSRAQFVALDTKVQVLNSSAALAFASGDLGQYLLTGKPIR